MPFELDAAVANWRQVAAAPQSAVTAARLQLHHAAQVVNAPAMSYLAKAADDSHTNFGWDADLSAFVSRRIEFPAPRRFALRPVDLTLEAMDDAGKIVATLHLAGQTFAGAHSWARAECEKAGGDGAKYTDKKHYEIPPHAVGGGAVFDADPAALRMLAQLWANAVPLLNAVAAGAGKSASEVRLWPHHFDVGVLLTIDAKRSIGGGFTPGDHYYDEPYWYFSPYPKPTAPRWPPLAGGGAWRDGEFFSAVLRWSDYAESRVQGVEAGAYVQSALAGCRSLLE